MDPFYILFFSGDWDTSTHGLLPGADPCNEPSAPSAPPCHIEPLLRGLSRGRALDWSFCDPPPSTMSLPAVRWRPPPLGGESRAEVELGEAGCWSTSRPAVRVDQGQDPLLLCREAQAHLRPPSNVASTCPQLKRVSSGERGLETAASVFQVEQGGRVRACCRRSPVVLREGGRGCDRESDCPVNARE